MSGNDVVECISKIKDMEAAFKEVGDKYGFKDVTVEFADFREFKVQWSRSYRQAHFKVSDYLFDAPKDAFLGLANTLFSKIVGKADEPYSKAMRDWVLDPGFSKKWRPLYLKRSSGLNTEKEGEERNLQESVRRLIEMGLVDPDEEFEVCWNDDYNRKAATSSLLMRLIAVSRKLDNADLPDYAIDYALYTQYLKIVCGAKVFGYTTEVFTRDDEKKFQNYKKAEELLGDLGIYL